ncbi:hypothetical protein NDU88_006387 [Pleurodeles waltl]|uniref:Uncharacterized protein n=1 Tax=Pleurodeles waltl TaxID=8319 RepID=A0AAV7SPB3_PLEWA|nr:hypothetical protein NDU88_006387 [Pleurodeles waltl]
MHGENRSPSLGSRPSGEDSARLGKGGVAGPAARTIDRGPHRDPTRRRRKSRQRNKNTIMDFTCTITK